MNRNGVVDGEQVPWLSVSALVSVVTPVPFDFADAFTTVVGKHGCVVPVGVKVGRSLEKGVALGGIRIKEMDVGPLCAGDLR